MEPDENDIVCRLRKRAEIRRKIPRGEPDRISDLCEEAAVEIEKLRQDRAGLLIYVKRKIHDGAIVFGGKVSNECITLMTE